MSNRKRLWYAILSVAMVLSAAGFALGQETGVHPTVRNIAEIKFGTVPGLPTCALGSVQSGDPMKEPSIILAKISAGCSIPWHWHAANEHLMLVSGAARLEAKDGKPMTLRSGGFAMMPSRHVHQFRCTKACTMYVYSDGPFDIHYVNAQGQEMSPADALKAVKETAGK